MHDNEPWTLEEAVYRAAEYGTGNEVIWPVPADAVIAPGTGPDPYDGMVITHWTHDA